MYFANPELILISLLASADEEERHLAIKMIRDKIRKGAEMGDSTPRQFKTPAVNFQAQKLTELIDWNSVKLTEPLLTCVHSHLASLQA